MKAIAPASFNRTVDEGTAAGTAFDAAITATDANRREIAYQQELQRQKSQLEACQKEFFQQGEEVHGQLALAN